MGTVNAFVNQSILIDLPADYADTGWRIEGGIAYHNGCNSGLISLRTPLDDGFYYIKYEVLERISGQLYLSSVGVTGESRTTNGVFTEVFEVKNNLLQFFSDGTLALRNLSISPILELATDNSYTLAFAEKANAFVTRYSFVPYLMCKFINSFFSFKDGQLWEHNVNPIRNMFYGQKYKSSVSFYVNVQASDYKEFQSIMIESNAKWSAPNKGNIKILPSERNPQGMESRLKEGRFKNYGGTYCADFLRDMDDPRFDNDNDALMFGAHLQGQMMLVTIENDSDDEAILDKVRVTADKIFNI